MDTSLTVKPRDSAARAGQSRPQAVRTDLSPAQSVSAPAAVEASRPGHHAPDATYRDVVDPKAQEVIYRARDERNRKRASDEALMRQRAYGRAAHDLSPDAAELARPDDASPHADIEV